jgi:hypothetical protein
MPLMLAHPPPVMFVRVTDCFVAHMFQDTKIAMLSCQPKTKQISFFLHSGFRLTIKLIILLLILRLLVIHSLTVLSSSLKV